VHAKVEQINDYLFIDTNQIKKVVNEKRVNDSEIV